MYVSLPFEHSLKSSIMGDLKQLSNEMKTKIVQHGLGEGFRKLVIVSTKPESVSMAFSTVLGRQLICY